MAPSLIIIRLLVVAAALASPAAGQGTGGAASCTASVITSFTPCLNFLTNSTNGGSAPTADCCRSLAALMSAGTGCACLVLTGGLPLGGGAINRTLAVSLPKACNSGAVPLQCPDTSSAQVPAAPGPGGDDSPEPEAPAATVDPTATAPVSEGETRPAVLPSSARRASADGHTAAAAFALLLAVGAALV